MSNLLEQASLVMIPSGYKEDVVYSVIPTSGAGDLTFTRASNGTRIDSNGNVEVVPWNLFGNSEDGTSGKWGNEYNIASVTLNSTTAPNGTNTGNLVVENSVNGTHWFEQSFSAISGTPYTISVYFKAKERTQCVLFGFADNGVFLSQIVIFDLSTGAVVSQSGTQTNSIENVGGGWYRCSMTLTAGASATGYFAYGLANGGSNSYQGNGTSGLYMWGRQLNTGTLKPYFPTTDRLNVPRLTYQNGGGGCPSLLLEKQSTNLFIRSEEFNTSWVVTSGSVTSNQAISPDGTQIADLLTGEIYQQALQANSTTYSYSLYVKKDTGTTVYIGYIDNVTGFVGGSIVYTYSTGAISINQSANASVSGEAITVGNGWIRLVMKFTTIASVTFNYQYIGSGGSYIWGAQLEASSYPTSYIPTTSSSATRVADACYKTGISSLIGQTEGVVYAEIYPQEFQDASYIGISDGSISNRIIFGFEAGSVNSGNLLTFGKVSFSSSFTATRDQKLKVAIGYKSGDSVLYINGTQIGVDTSTFTATFNQAGYNWQTPGQPFKGKSGGLYLFPTRLTNSELAQLTGNQNYTINQAYESYGVASESPNCVQP